MRQNTFFSQFKQSLFEHLKPSSSTSTLDEEVENSKKLFYRDVLKKKLLKKCEIIEVEVLAHSSLTLPFATYVIQVQLGKLQFQARRRFSDFWSFYQNSHLGTHVGTIFPSKTYLRPSWTPSITQHRASCFNEFMKQILHFVVDEQLIFEFYEFLALYEHIKQTTRDSEQESEYQQNQVPIDTFLVNKIEQINQDADHILELLLQLKERIANRHQRINYDLAKHCLLGNGSQYGLLSIILDNDNQLIVREGLELILSMLQPERNRDYDIFVKALCKCEANQLYLNHSQLMKEDNLIKIRYFQLLRNYLEIHYQIEPKQIFSEHEGGQELQQEYHKWIKVRRFNRQM